MNNLLQVCFAFWLLFGIIGCASTNLQQKPDHFNLIPMYGGIEKTEKQIKADSSFIQIILAKGYTRKTGSKHVAKLGWKYYRNGDWKTAMKRFNQSWLLDSDNSESYVGFAIITADQKNSRAEVEELFKTAISKSNAGPSSYVNYGRYLWTQSAFDKSITLYKQAINRFSKAYNARSGLSFVYYQKGNFEKACYWAKLAKEHNDELEPGYLESICSR